MGNNKLNNNKLDKKKIGKIVENIRNSNELTKKEFSNLCDINILKLSLIEKGILLPTLKMIIILCNVFKISSESFLVYLEK